MLRVKCGVCKGCPWLAGLAGHNRHRQMQKMRNTTGCLDMLLSQVYTPLTALLSMSAIDARHVVQQMAHVT